MQESYVKYEVAELLKKQGFNEECASFYLKNDKTLRFTEKPLKDVGEAVILVPTMIQFWDWRPSVNK